MPSQTITTTAQQAQRLATALGVKLGLGRDANADEIKQYGIDCYRAVVHEYEAEQRRIALNTPDPFEPT
jgi:hypothetical protein